MRIRGPSSPRPTKSTPSNDRQGVVHRREPLPHLVRGRHPRGPRQHTAPGQVEAHHRPRAGPTDPAPLTIKFAAGPPVKLLVGHDVHGRRRDLPGKRVRCLEVAAQLILLLDLVDAHLQPDTSGEPPNLAHRPRGGRLTIQFSDVNASSAWEDGRGPESRKTKMGH